MSLSILLPISLLFGGLFVFGVLLCLILYRWDYRRFFASSLWVKTYVWIPIFLVFLGVLQAGIFLSAPVVAIIALLAVRELRRAPGTDSLALIYGLVVVGCMASLPLFSRAPNDEQLSLVLIATVFSSVMSDITAYFMGNFVGRHKLPSWINPGKSWEGVLGQLLGAVLGFYLITLTLDLSLPVTLALLIGAASASGDIINSILKRRLNIKDWGRTIPGHGGVLDRFASLSFALAIGFLWAQFSL